MDRAVLIEKGFNPSLDVVAYLHDVGLRIGRRATLIQSRGERVYGTVMSLDEKELDRLYVEASVKDYVHETVRVKTIEGFEQSVRVYNLPQANDDEKNLVYAKLLRQVAEKLGLPSDYIAELGIWCD